MREECRTGYVNQVEKEVVVSQVDAFRTRNGSTRYVLRDEDGDEYTTFREAIARDALGAEGRRARIEQRRGDFTNVYLDGVTPLEEDDNGGEDVARADEVAWKTAVEAAPLFAGTERGIEAEELYEKLKAVQGPRRRGHRARRRGERVEA
jgi:hypothetical protein